MTALDFGLLIHSTPRGGTVPEMAATNERILQAASEHDLSVWVIDHFQFDQQFLLECFAYLAHTAGRYPSLRYGTLVLGQGYRNPALTAKIAASLDWLTGGRFILGIGAGWKEDEYRAYGYPYPGPGVRIAQLREAVQIIRRMWSESPASFSGDYFQVLDAYCEPRPDPQPTILIGGGGERKTLRVVAELADWWNIGFRTVEEYTAKVDLLRRHCADIGRDPGEIALTYYGHVALARDPDKVERQDPVRPGQINRIAGTPDEVAQQLNAFVDLGVQHFMLKFADFPRLDQYELFMADVVPQLQARSAERGTRNKGTG